MKYDVQVSRSRVYTKTLNVEARTEEEATKQALAITQDTDVRDWASNWLDPEVDCCFSA
jgi:hypothetical protein